jgi:hypothetical protein
VAKSYDIAYTTLLSAILVAVLLFAVFALVGIKVETIQCKDLMLHRQLAIQGLVNGSVEQTHCGEG